MKTKSTERHENSKFWVISNGRNITIKEKDGDETHHAVREYKISQFGYYLVSPAMIEVKDRLVGTRVTVGTHSLKNRLHHLFSGKKATPDTPFEEVTLYSSFQPKSTSAGDSHFSKHINNLFTKLAPYDPFQKQLKELAQEQIMDVTGICRDIADNRYKLDLHGTVNEKLEYVAKNIGTPVHINMKCAHLTKGLFELRAFDFKAFDSSHEITLYSFLKKGVPTFYVSPHQGAEGFFIEEPALFYCLHILQQSLEVNSDLKDLFGACVDGTLHPFKLFFSKQLEFQYSREHLPLLIRQELRHTMMNDQEIGTIADLLNDCQRVVSFNYVPNAVKGREKMLTNISVMHDFKALEPLKKNHPDLYNRISLKAPTTEVGKLYLLDTIKGSTDDD
ncbi:MAG: hypothetical protein MI742_15725 [Desulfobacterales bacterium]|nr:hypothetical protein [Desulfobacterales bacterium]